MPAATLHALDPNLHASLWSKATSDAPTNKSGRTRNGVHLVRKTRKTNPFVLHRCSTRRGQRRGSPVRRHLTASMLIAFLIGANIGGIWLPAAVSVDFRGQPRVESEAVTRPKTASHDPAIVDQGSAVIYRAVISPPARVPRSTYLPTVYESATLRSRTTAGAERQEPKADARKPDHLGSLRQPVPLRQ
jgi:hypothetical protein